MYQEDSMMYKRISERQSAFTILDALAYQAYPTVLLRSLQQRWVDKKQCCEPHCSSHLNKKTYISLLH